MYVANQNDIWTYQLDKNYKTYVWNRRQDYIYTFLQMFY